MRSVSWLGVMSVVLLPLFAGCARFPTTETPSGAPPRTLYSEITVAGEINPTYYYFLAIDTDGNQVDGPVPVVTGPELGNGWGTISGLGPNDPIQEPPFYVMYHNGTFEQFRNGIPLGRPFNAEVSQDRKRIILEIDQRVLAPTGTALPSIVQLNWITMPDLTIPPQNVGFIKEYDGIGPSGNNYLDTIPLTQSWIRYSGDEYGTPLELPNDTTTTADIDLIGWRVEIRLLAGG